MDSEYIRAASERDRTAANWWVDFPPPQPRAARCSRRGCARSMRPMKIHEIMSSNVRSVSPDNTLIEAAGLMRALDVGALPVCEHGHLTGMVTDHDIVLRAVADGCDPEHTSVREALSNGAVFAYADDEVEAAARTMEEHQIRRLPVLNRAKQLVGIVSLGDIAVRSNPAFGGIALKEVSQPQ